MKRTWPIIAVEDVAASSAWYRQLLGQRQQPLEHDDFDIVSDDDDTVLVALHEWGAHGEGPPLLAKGVEAPGNGVLLFLRVDDFDATLQRARSLSPRLKQTPRSFSAALILGRSRCEILTATT